MQKPVAMPRGGMTIFFKVTAVRPSRTRHSSTPQSPKREMMAVSRVFDSMKQAFLVWCDEQRGGADLYIHSIVLDAGSGEGCEERNELERWAVHLIRNLLVTE